MKFQKDGQYSDQKIRRPRNSYEILENDRKSLTNFLVRKLDDHGILMLDFVSQMTKEFFNN